MPSYHIPLGGSGMTSKKFYPQTKSLLKHYWIQITISTIFVITASVLAESITPKPRSVPNDPKYQQPFLPYETVPFLLLIAVCVVTPVFIMIGYVIASKNLDLFFCVASSLLMGFGICFMLSESFKLGVRRPRPYAAYKIPFDTPNYNLIETAFRKQIIKEGFKSFPSGHTSNGLCGTTMLFLFFTGQAQFNGSKRSIWLSILIELILIYPVLIGVGVGISRVLDKRHHITDVLFGAFIGVFSSSFSFFFHFYPIWSKKSSLPRFSAASKESDAELL